jgi:uncharacterized membrane protein YebE (DUF533 family)
MGIVKFNTMATNATPTASKSGGGFGTIVLLGLVAVAGYFGYKEYQKYKEKQKQNGI